MGYTLHIEVESPRRKVNMPEMSGEGFGVESEEGFLVQLGDALLEVMSDLEIAVFLSGKIHSSVL
ncbi:MAG: hypothetical protein K0Q50_191 [Vampirovibrio sp.]|jgi:hypothetical protein|nr:hypothetical protein [Vampirovibrio sp.]